ncbi:MAG: hypothetical protein HDT39_04530 [Lachnospiraceae bacterium]|nr:hypothetical protein [Lachnospiraceae bacterium]
MEYFTKGSLENTGWEIDISIKSAKDTIIRILKVISNQQFANELVRLEHPMGGLESFKVMTLCMEETGIVY